MGRVGSYPTFSPLPHLADGSVGRGGISLLHLSWGHPRRALPVILALWSPDFPHLGAFAAQPRLSNLVATILYFTEARLSNILQILFGKDILYQKNKFRFTGQFRTTNVILSAAAKAAESKNPHS